METHAEELRGRILLLEDGLSKAEHEAATKGAALRKLEADFHSRTDAFATELRSAQAMVDELSGEVQRGKERLAAATRSRATAQEEAANVGIALGEVEARASARVLAMEAQVGGLVEGLKGAQRELEEVREREEAARAALGEANGELSGLVAERDAYAASLALAQEEARGLAASYAAQISALTTSLGALDKQNKGAQALLASLLEQRKALEGEVARLSGDGE